MKKEIEIGGVQWFYEIYEDSDYDFYYIETRFYRTKTKIVNKRKYWIFGEKFQVEVEKGPRDFDFKLPFSIKNPKYTPGELRADLLNVSEWRNPVIYYALGFNILPKAQQLTTDKLSWKIAEYHDKFSYDWRNLIEFGISYDIDGTTIRFIEENEEFEYIRLRK